MTDVQVTIRLGRKACGNHTIVLAGGKIGINAVTDEIYRRFGGVGGVFG